MITTDSCKSVGYCLGLYNMHPWYTQDQVTTFHLLFHFEDYSILNYSNHVQSDNKDFSRALGSTVAICTCPPSKVCVPFSPSPQRNYFPMVFLTSLGKSIRSISCFDNILIIISFVRTNLSRAPDKASHIHMRERKEVVLASLRDKMS